MFEATDEKKPWWPAWARLLVIVLVLIVVVPFCFMLFAGLVFYFSYMRNIGKAEGLLSKPFQLHL